MGKILRTWKSLVINEKLFKKVLELPNGIPSHDTFNRVFQAIDPSSLKQLLDRDGRQLLGCLENKQLVLDGKKLKGVSPKSKGNSGLWILYYELKQWSFLKETLRL